MSDNRSKEGRTPRHQWVEPCGPIRYVHCSVCLIIQTINPSNRNKPRKGAAKVGPR